MVVAEVFDLEQGEFDASVSLDVIVYASVLAILCEIVSGAYPAFRATSIAPIRSLQA